MKKCPYCEAKRTIRKFRTAKRFFAKCEFCKANELKILEEKRDASIRNCDIAASVGNQKFIEEIDMRPWAL